MRASHHRLAAGRHRAVRSVALLLLTGLVPAVGLPYVTSAQSAPIAQQAHDTYGVHITEASQRFRIPERWIRAVMQVESTGRTRAVSSAGAMGLMQIMPDTWAELRTRHRLGRDPFDPRDNILGGTAYLREMYDRFGSPGFLAAYNAGPQRYQDHLATGRSLPRETRVYVATLLPMIGLASRDNTGTVVPPPPDWREAPLFVERSQRNSAADGKQDARRLANDPSLPKPHAENADAAQPDTVFVAQSRTEKSP